MQAILIDAAAHDIRAVEYDTFTDLQRLVGGLITVAWRFDNEDVLFVDDEGLFKPQEGFFRVATAEQPFAGNGVLVGADCDNESEGTEPPGTTVAELAAMVHFMSPLQVQLWARQNADRPATTIITLGNTGMERTVINTIGDLFDEED